MSENNTQNEQLEEIKKLQTLAKFEEDSHNYEKAEEYYTKLLEIDPNNLDFLLDHAKIAGKLSTIYNPRYQEILNFHDNINQQKDSLGPDRYKQWLAKLLTIVADVMSERFDEVFKEKSQLSKQKFENYIWQSCGSAHAAAQSMDFKMAFQNNYREMLMTFIEYWHNLPEEEMLNDPVCKPAYLKICLLAMKLLTSKYQVMLPYRHPYMVKMRSFTEGKTAFCFLRKYTKRMKQYYPKDTKLPGEGGCYIATAVYGSYDCPEVWVLRRFRDEALAKHVFGRMFINAYYAISPTLVQMFGNSKIFNACCHKPLDMLVKELKAKGISDTPYQD